MSAMTARALGLAVAVAVWTAISHLGKLPLLLWPVIIGLACYLAAGGGVAGFRKSAVGVTTGVIWAMLYVTVSGALGRQPLLDALVLGAAVFGMVYQARVQLLAYTPAVIAGAATALGVMGLRTVTMQGGVRVVVALLIGTAIGYGAELLTGAILSKAKARIA
jgi:hypothetical protein